MARTPTERPLHQLSRHYPLETTMDITHIQELDGDNRRGADVRREARENGAE